MSVTVEFFGIPRQRVGVASVDVSANTLGELVEQLQRRYPRFAESCVTERQLASGYLANLNGERFTRDPEASLKAGDSVLILSADVGG